MIPWIWVLASAWAGGVTVGLLSAVILHHFAGGSRFNFAHYLSTFFWPVSFPILFFVSLRAQITPTQKFAARVITDAPLESRTGRNTVAKVFEPCEACAQKLREYQSTYKPPPGPCPACVQACADWSTEFDEMNAAFVSTLCEPCKKGLRV